MQKCNIIEIYDLRLIENEKTVAPVSKYDLRQESTNAYGKNTY